MLKMETDSAYDRDSILGNFKRLVGDPVKLKGKGKSDLNKPMFRMSKEKYQADLYVELWPYRNGSKAVIVVGMTTWQTSSEGTARTINVQQIIDQVKKDVEGIVNS